MSDRLALRAGVKFPFFRRAVSAVAAVFELAVETSFARLASYWPMCLWHRHRLPSKAREHGVDADGPYRTAGADKQIFCDFFSKKVHFMMLFVVFL